MKRLLRFREILGFRWFLTSFFVSWTCLFSAPIGNPASPAILQEGFFISDVKWCQPRAAFAEDFLIQQKLSGSRHDAHIGKGLVKGNSSLGSASWSILERLDLSGIAGSGQHIFNFHLPGQAFRMKARGGLIWYGEAKWIILEVRNASLSAFGQAGGWDWVNGSFSLNGKVLSSRAQVLMRFWTVGATMTYKLNYFDPYIGVVVMRSRWKIDHTVPGAFLFHQKYPVGPLIGCSVSNNSKVLLNFEWRGWIEQAFTVSGEIRF